MIVFSNSKINLGLWILNKRPDGYHNISTIFYPIHWCDIIEIIPNDSEQNQINIQTSGISLNIPSNHNIIYKAYRLLLDKYGNLPALKIFLHKNVPFGAGLGAGSANAAFFIKSCNSLLNLNMTPEEMKNISSTLGADCAFFIDNIPALASQKGDVLSHIPLSLHQYYILVIFPNIPISTQEAYRNIMPFERKESLLDIVQLPITEWKNYLTNDFENNIFKTYPLIEKIKQSLYENGAVYASMSGSGSSVYGIFNDKPDIKAYKEWICFLEQPRN
ncbi:MAG: 4-(cytidine 5'-diphospho)-2-C-methyl-D-erythritol kinase [Bacteroidia bacterium]